MKLTRNLVLFVSINILSSIGLIIATKYGWLTTVNKTETTISYESSLPIIYFAIWLISGTVLSRLDSARVIRISKDLSYSIASCVVLLIALVIGAIILGIGLFTVLFLIALITISIVTTVQFYIEKSKPKGMSKEEIFK